MTSSPTGPAEPAPGRGAGDADAPAPAAAPRAAAIVVGHGDFAAGMVSAVAAITGRGDALVAVSNRDATVDEIERRLAEAADRHGARVVFTDLPAGSCAFAARRLLRARPELVVVTGASLPALVDFVFRADLPPDDAAARAAEAGRAALALVRAPAPAAGTHARGERAG